MCSLGHRENSEEIKKKKNTHADKHMETGLKYSMYIHSRKQSVEPVRANGQNTCHVRP